MPACGAEDREQMRTHFVIMHAARNGASCYAAAMKSMPGDWRDRQR